jgi:flagellar hook assembly protein FlgD
VFWRLSWSGYLANNSVTGVNDRGPTNELRLGNATPNPLDDETRVGFTLSKHSRITLRVVDVHGRVVRTLFKGREQAGEHNLVWNACDDHGRSVQSGMYFIELLADKERHTRKAIVLN